MILLLSDPMQGTAPGNTHLGEQGALQSWQPLPRPSHLAGYLGLLCLLIQRHLLPMVAHKQVVCALEGQQRQSLDSLALNRQLACACTGGRGSMRGRPQSAVCRSRRRLGACPEDAGHRCGSSWQHCPSCMRQLAWLRPGGGAAGSAGGAAAAMVQRCCS